MATRYWVGGSGTWNSINTANWSTSRLGSGGSSVPTAGDDVIFDVTTSTTVTVSGEVNCANLSLLTTNIPVIIIGSQSDSINVYGSNVTLDLSNLYSFNGWLNLKNGSTSVTNSQSSTNQFFQYLSIADGCNAVISFGISALKTEELKLGNGSSCSIITNDYATKKVTIGSNSQVVFGDSPRYLKLSGSSPFVMSSTNSSIAGSGPTGCIVESTISTTLDIDGVVTSLYLKPMSSGATFVFDGVGTIANLYKFNGNTETTSCNLDFVPLNNLKVSNWDIQGNSTTTIYVRSSIPGTRSTVEKHGGGIVSTNYMNVKDMQPVPDSTWISYNSTNSGNNYQWYFNNFNKPTSNLFFGSHL